MRQNPRNRAIKTDSVALEADALHLRTDVYRSVGVLGGLVAITSKASKAKALKLTLLWLLVFASHFVSSTLEGIRRSTDESVKLRLQFSFFLFSLTDHAYGG